MHCGGVYREIHRQNHYPLIYQGAILLGRDILVTSLAKSTNSEDLFVAIPELLFFVSGIRTILEVPKIESLFKKLTFQDQKRYMLHGFLNFQKRSIIP